MFVKIIGQPTCLGRAVDSVNEILDVLVQSRCNKQQVLRLPRKLLQ